MFEWIKEKFTSKSRAADAFYQEAGWTQLGEDRTSDPNFERIAREAFNKNPKVYAALDTIADAVMTSPLKVVNQDGEEVEAPITTLLETPNPHQTMVEFLKRVVFHLGLTGNAYIRKVRGRNGQVVELRILQPDQIEIKPDVTPGGFIASYKLRRPDTAQAIVIPPEDIIHFRKSGPQSQLMGVAPMTPAISQLNIDNEATRFTFDLLYNNGSPGGILAIKDGNSVPTEELRRFKEYWQANHGRGNRGGVAIMRSDANYMPVTQTMADMAFLSIRKVSESDILMCFRVPPEVLRSTVGIDSKYTNMEEARKIFWMHCVIPWQKEIASFIARDLDLVPEGLRVEFDNSKVEALREIRERHMNSTVQLLQGGVIQVNEAREREGLEPVEGGDVFLISVGSTLEDDLDDAEEESEPSPENKPEEDEEKQLPGKFRSKSLDSVNLKIALNRVGAVDEEFNGIRNFISRKYKQWATEVRSAFGRSRKSIDQAKFNEVISSLEVKWAQEIRQEVQEHMQSSIERGAESAKADLAKELILDQGEVLKAVDQEAFKFAYSVSHTAAQEVRAVVKRAAEEGLTIRQARTLLAETFETWDTNRAERVARSETMRAVNKGAQLRYKAAGVVQKRWIAALDSCPICKSLDGKVVGIEEAFVPEGHELPSLDPTVKQTASYGPVENGNAHPNCRCTIGPQ